MATSTPMGYSASTWTPAWRSIPQTHRPQSPATLPLVTRMSGLGPNRPVRIPSLPTRACRSCGSRRAAVPVVRFRSPPGRGCRTRAEGYVGGAGPPEELEIGPISPNFAQNRGIPAETPASGTDSQENVAGIARGSPDRLPFLPTAGPGDPPAALRHPASDHLLEGLQRQCPDDVAGGLAAIVIGRR